MNSIDDFRGRINDRSLAWFAGLCLLFTYPVIAADILHRDDVWRAASGKYFWTVQGRPIADFLTQHLGLSGANVINSAPFSQIIFGFCLFVSFWAATRFFERNYGEKFSLPLAVLFLNPFLLSNLLYQYDSLGMGVGIALTVAAFVVGSGFEVRKLAASVIILTIVAGIYQPLLNLVIGLCALQIAASAVTLGDLREALRIICLRATQYCAAAILYYVAIGLPLSAANGRSEIVSLDAQGFGTAYTTTEAFLAFAIRFFASGSPAFQFVFAAFALASLIALVLWMMRSRAKAVAAATFLLALFAAVLSLFGPLIFVENVLASYRTMPSSIAPVAVLAVALWKSRVLWPAAALPIFVAVVLSFQLMATYKAQRDFDEFVAGLIAAEVNTQRLSDHAIYTFGSVQRAPHAALGAELHPMIDDLTAPAQRWVFEGLLIEKGLRNTVPLWSHQRPALDARIADLACDDIQTKTATDRFEIREAGESLFVILSGAPSLPCKG